MASFASSATTGGARKHAWTKSAVAKTRHDNSRRHAWETTSYTPGTAGGPGARDRTLAVKNRKKVRKITFFLKQARLRSANKLWDIQFFNIIISISISIYNRNNDFF